MGRRTGHKPTADDTFLWRICHALDILPYDLAKLLEVPYADIYNMLGHRTHVVEQDMEEIWWKIAELVDEQLGYLMAARLELSKALQKDRTARVLRHEQFRARDKKPVPRSRQ